MFTIVVFEESTRKVKLALPLVFENDAVVSQEDAIVWNGLAYEVFANKEPVLYEDADGDICLKPNCCIINSGDLIN